MGIPFLVACFLMTTGMLYGKMGLCNSCNMEEFRCRAKTGKQLQLFVEIDHLKEINDSFGHAAGDFAITTAADFLRHCIPEDAAIARIGGDEYVALVVADCEDGCDVLTKRLEKHARDFNMSSDKPFYVEMSAGIYSFTCEKNTDIPEILKHSDEVLYEKKKNRRVTIRKVVNGEE